MCYPQETGREHLLRLALESFMLAKHLDMSLLLEAADVNARKVLVDLFPGHPGDKLYPKAKA